MITNKDREIAVSMTKIWMRDSEGNQLEELAGIIARIRAESAEQARKEAAERVACAWREHGEDITLRILRAAILSTVNESFTVAHVSTDAEKLAIAVKALKAIQSVEHDSSSITYRECNNALKEIQ